MSIKTLHQSAWDFFNGVAGIPTAAFNLAQLVGTAVAVGAGAVSAGVQRITLASDDPAVTSLGTIAGDTTSLDGKTPSLGSAIASASVPVVLASDSSDINTETEVETDYIDGDASAVVITISDATSTQSAALTAGYWHIHSDIDVSFEAGGSNPTATAASHPLVAGSTRGVWINDANDKVAAIRRIAAAGSVWFSKAKSNG